MGLFKKKETKIRRPYTVALIAAAGNSSRMGNQNKLFAYILGVPVIAHTLLAFENCDEIDEIVITTSANSILQIGEICREYSITKVSDVISGGETRMASVTGALVNLKSNTEYVAIHDGARPLVPKALISQLVWQAIESGSAIPIVPLKDTIKYIDGSTAVSSPDRTKLAAVQTPQVFQLDLIKCALLKAADEDFTLTDDSSALERMGIKVQTVEGTYKNIKITTPEDLAIAEALLINKDH